MGSGVVSDPKEYGLHSCRRGAATNAVNAGGDPQLIAKAMRVKTISMVHYYAKVSEKKLADTCNLVFA